ncbi:MAG: hypothetical protein ABSH52_16015 [Terriglobia bacterium]|jgi:hypothetical protein
MNEVMSLIEIQKKFDSEWILIEDPETTESLEITKGRVLWHSKNRDEVYRKAREFSPQSSAILYTGTIPQEGELVL